MVGQSVTLFFKGHGILIQPSYTAACLIRSSLGNMFDKPSATLAGADGYSTPQMGDLARAAESISPDAPVPQLLALFHKREDLLAVPLLDERED